MYSSVGVKKNDGASNEPLLSGPRRLNSARSCSIALFTLSTAELISDPRLVLVSAAVLVGSPVEDSDTGGRCNLAAILPVKFFIPVIVNR